MESWISLCFGILCVSTVMGTSFVTKQRYYNFMVRSRARGKDYAGKEIKGEECKDLIKDCMKYQRYCDEALAGSKVLRKHCPKTCGLCDPRFPHPPYRPICHMSEFGCCWDNFTSALGHGQQGCPECVDIVPDCEFFDVKDCDKVGVKRSCPVTCGVQCPDCQDDPYKRQLCPFFKKTGFCKVDPTLMTEICKRTCEFC